MAQSPAETDTEGGSVGPFTITLANCGGQAFEVYGDELLLDALEERGVSLPYGCRYGGCITCAARLVAGAVDQSEGVALKPYQLAEGYVLLCVAYPRSDCTLDIGVESHDRLYRNPFANPIYDEKMITGDRVEPRDLEQKP